MFELWSKTMKASVAEEARSQIAASRHDERLYFPLFDDKNTSECVGFLILAKPSNLGAMTLEEWAKIDA